MVSLFIIVFLDVFLLDGVELDEAATEVVHLVLTQPSFALLSEVLFGVGALALIVFCSDVVLIVLLLYIFHQVLNRVLLLLLFNQETIVVLFHEFKHIRRL